MDIIKFAIPFFLLLMGFEYLLSKRKGIAVYKSGDTFADLGCGVLQQVLGMGVKLSFIFVYIWVGQNFSLQQIWGLAPWPRTWWSWALAFLTVDFVYYWFHRFSHEVNFLWAAHVVHHQSEEYNLAVALRQGGIQNIFNFAFFLILALLGLPVEMVAVSYSLNLLYQFWIHTRLVGNLGWFELFFNTPSHHRVHHGINPIYIDKNHAGVLIVWDRLFGTYQEETEEVVFGITAPLKSWSPVWSHLQPYAALIEISKATSRWSDKFRIWIADPGWKPMDLGGPARPKPVRRSEQIKYETHASARAQRYVRAHFVLLLALTLLLDPLIQQGRGLFAFGIGLSVAVGLASLAGVLESKSWVRVVEPVRQAALLGLGLVYWMV